MGSCPRSFLAETSAARWHPKAITVRGCVVRKPCRSEKYSHGSFAMRFHVTADGEAAGERGLGLLALSRLVRECFEVCGGKQDAFDGVAVLSMRRG